MKSLNNSAHTDYIIINNLNPRYINDQYIQIINRHTHINPLLISGKKYTDTEDYSIVATIDITHTVMMHGSMLLMIHRLNCYDKDCDIDIIRYLLDCLVDYAYTNRYTYIYTRKREYTVNHLNILGFNYDPTTGLYRKEVE